MSVTVVIRYDGTDISDSVLFSTATFESQLSATPGTFEFTVRDMDQTHSFITGKEITLDIDGTRYFGGYLTMVSRTFAIDVDDTTVGGGGPAGVETRQWVLRGVDYNIMFDKRVLRNPNNYLTHIPSYPVNTMDGALIRDELPKYIDVPPGFNLSAFVDNVAKTVLHPASGQTVVAWQQQGTPWRTVMEQLAVVGQIWYIDANKNLHWHAIETQQSSWGFSDVPNHLPLSSPALPTYGFREMDAAEDGSLIINDALVWGGSEFTGTGTTVFAREQNTGSIATHNRWQVAETHFGELGFFRTEDVETRASLIVEGTPSAQGDQLYGLKFPQWNFRFAWHDHNVPEMPTAGKFYPIILYTFGTDAAHPLIQQLPLRSVRITFPELNSSGAAYVRFDGFFGIQANDPWTFWKFLLQNRTRVVRAATNTVNNDSTSATYGSYSSLYVNETPDGSRTTFSVKFPYISGTTQVSLSGIFQRPNIEYTESNPEAGEITFASPPQATDWIWVTSLASGT